MKIKEILKEIKTGKEEGAIELWIDEETFGCREMEIVYIPSLNKNVLLMKTEKEYTFKISRFKNGLEGFDKNLEIFYTSGEETIAALNSAKMVITGNTKELKLILTNGFLQCNCK